MYFIRICVHIHVIFFTKGLSRKPRLVSILESFSVILTQVGIINTLSKILILGGTTHDLLHSAKIMDSGLYK